MHQRAHRLEAKDLKSIASKIEFQRETPASFNFPFDYTKRCCSCCRLGFSGDGVGSGAECSGSGTWSWRGVVGFLHSSHGSSGSIAKLQPMNLEKPKPKQKRLEKTKTNSRKQQIQKLKHPTWKRLRKTHVERVLETWFFWRLCFVGFLQVVCYVAFELFLLGVSQDVLLMICCFVVRCCCLFGLSQACACAF